MYDEMGLPSVLSGNLQSSKSVLCMLFVTLVYLVITIR